MNSKYLRKRFNYEKLWSISKILASVGFTQGIIQIIGFISGILLIRLLPAHEYALYTLANTMLGTMTVLADGGISTGVMSLGGQVWQDKEKLGTVLSTGIYLRKKFAVISLFFTLPVLIVLLNLHESRWYESILIILTLIPALNSALTTSIFQVAYKLDQKFAFLQKIQLLSNAARLIFLVPFIIILPWSWIAIFIAGLTQIWSNYYLRKDLKTSVNINLLPSKEVEGKIFLTVKRILPTSVYYCFSSQITIWVISIFGSTNSLAQIGGLSRLSILFTFFTTVFNTVFIPKFARLPKSSSMVKRSFIGLQLILLAISVIIVFIAYIFSNQIIFLLGSNFNGLNKEVVLIIFSGCLGLISTSTNQLLSVRGIIMNPYIFITVAVIVQIAVALIMPLNEVVSVIYYGIFTTGTIYFVRLIYLALELKKNNFN
ncbi:polysaccharide biosynthesis protein [Spirosoma sp. KCTC 42546]|uniref:lipopolysaccharide biosynthesis protein n=1 Tax=Spirosoma sp. KCTC 42546 TaxID=2520506 RepID=UPI00115851ED|nr:polysaccharide biosynthesis protein [Spirosoma sp. KCTC 42546]QDK78677.1 polysaccharide biosynthesis protein [Spirosoma sp. KCTC 42546]